MGFFFSVFVCFNVVKCIIFNNKEVMKVDS